MIKLYPEIMTQPISQPPTRTGRRHCALAAACGGILVGGFTFALYLANR